MVAAIDGRAACETFPTKPVPPSGEVSSAAHVDKRLLKKCFQYRNYYSTPTLADMAHYFIITITTGLLVVITLLLWLVFLQPIPPAIRAVAFLMKRPHLSLSRAVSGRLQRGTR
jgi:hypothetical protein